MASKLFDLFKRGSTQPVQSPAEDGQLAQAGLALKSGDLEGAVRLYDAVIARQSGSAEAHYKRANALNGLGRWELALAGYERAIELKPDYANAYCNRGTVLERMRRWEDALSSYDRAVALNSGDYFAHYNRGSVLKELLRFEEALASYERAISLKNDYAEAYVNRGHVLQELQRHEAAIASYDKGIELNPHYADAFLGRANSLSFLKRHEAAMASFDRALRLDPERKFLLGLRRAEQMNICDWSGLEAELETLAQAIEAGRPACPPFVTLALFDSPSLHSLAAETWVREKYPADRRLGDFVARKRGGKIKIGYFSADFREHPVAILTTELFESHDRSRFEVTAFSLGLDDSSAARERLKNAFDRFIDVRHIKDDHELALLARDHGIDIAVDLTGHTQGSRMGVFSQRAAPIQAAWLGYAGSTGAEYFDYLVGDRTVIPVEHQPHYSEKIVYLPHCYLTNDSTRAIADRPTREQVGLPAQGVVFCSFNNCYKFTSDVFSSWMRILSRVEGSVLWLAHNNVPTAAKNLLREAEKRGIDPRRVIFAGRTPGQPEHLARLQLADLFLDTLPYNAHSTAIDALWAGLPILTRLGSSFAGRVAASVLRAIELPELVTTSVQQYEELAVELGTNPARLATLKQRLADNRMSTPLFDSRSFVRQLEAAYLRMYERYREGLSPDHIEVS